MCPVWQAVSWGLIRTLACALVACVCVVGGGAFVFSNIGADAVCALLVCVWAEASSCADAEGRFALVYVFLIIVCP